MTSPLERLAGPGKSLAAEAPDAAEFAGLLRSGLARLNDAGNGTLALESRFDLAYNAAHALCLAALRCSGYRAQHRYIVFQVLPQTLGLGARGLARPGQVPRLAQPGRVRGRPVHRRTHRRRPGHGLRGGGRGARPGPEELTDVPTLDWIGKQAVVTHHKDVPYRLLEAVPEISCLPLPRAGEGRGEGGAAAADAGASGNLIVQGDNLHALKPLLPRYAAQVKCICIDPLYNTGNEGWAYNDNVNSPEIRRWLGEVVGKERQTLGCRPPVIASSRTS